MGDNLILGMAIGFMVGALLVHKSEKANEFIEEGKEKIVETIEKM